MCLGSSLSLIHLILPDQAYQPPCHIFSSDSDDLMIVSPHIYIRLEQCDVR